MLKKLRLKFVMLNMATVAVVLTVVFTAICVIDYQQSVARVHEALDAAASRAADAAGSPFGDANPPGEGTPGEPGPGSAAPQSTVPPEIGGKRGGSDSTIPVAVFSVDDDGTLSAAETHTTASLADDVLAQAVSQLTDAPEGYGNLDELGLTYEKRTVDNTVYLAFADMNATAGWQQLALTLAGVGVVALAAFLLISVFFSRWALRPVEAAWSQQRRFVADASHDLKTPLTVILANASILLEHPERSVASQSQWVESTQHEAERMQSLVGDLLLLAQVDENSTARHSFEQVDLSDLVEGEVLQFESVAFERAVQLNSNVEPGIAIEGDETRLRRLASTLLDNACKYADDGGIVDVTLDHTHDQVHLNVRNTGPLIASEDLPHVFDRFYRADKARAGEAGGFGLGLAIARAIAEEHGGTIIAASDAEHGTVFTATFSL